MPSAARVFAAHDAAAFAALSGDWNPAHVDPIEARRRLPGGLIAHGMHVVLWAIATAPQPDAGWRAISCLFRAPVRIGDRVTAASQWANESLLVTVHADDQLAVEIALTSGPPQECNVASGAIFPPGRPRRPTLEEIASAEGTVPLSYDETAASALWPSLAGRLTTSQVAVCLATSRLAGMECPGAQSLLHKVALDFARGATASHLIYHVTRLDRRFALVGMQVHGGGATGTVDAFVAPLPASQPAAASLASHVQPGTFAGARALVVGGSRGLGEATAKLLAIGGADVVITYRVGESDAVRVCDDIRSAGGSARAGAWDVEGKAPPPLPRDWQPTHLFYFATPPIVLNGRAPFSSARLHGYVSVYVDGFVRLLEHCLPASGRLVAFYPSTAALDEMLPGALEYATAKAAGEAACRHLQARYPRLHVQIARLPRVRTDATATVAPVDAGEAADVMLPEIVSLMSESRSRAEGTAESR